MSAAERLASIHQRIAAACSLAGRDRSTVELLAVSKTFPAEAVAALHAAGQFLFGESRQQEAAPKIEALPEGIQWHFIGGLQTNKVRKILTAFHTVHSVSSLRLASAIDRVASEIARRVPVYLEVNLAGEASKGGFSPEDLRASVEELSQLSSLQLLGLMAIPPADEEPRPWFARCRELRDSLSAAGLSLPGLSMGMSSDFELAILEGATIVRVGSALFGSRSYP